MSEVSKITGISKDTLHFYDKVGLLTPDYFEKKKLISLLFILEFMAAGYYSHLLHKMIFQTSNINGRKKLSAGEQKEMKFLTMKICWKQSEMNCREQIQSVEGTVILLMRNKYKMDSFISTWDI